MTMRQYVKFGLPRYTCGRAASVVPSAWAASLILSRETTGVDTASPAR